MDLLEDSEDDWEDTTEIKVNTSRRITDSGRTDMSSGIKSLRQSGRAEGEGLLESEVDSLIAERE